MSAAAPRSTNRVREHLGAPATREFVGATVEVCCGWTTRQAGERTSLEDLMARSDWAMLESREGRQATFTSVPATRRLTALACPAPAPF